MGCVSSTQHTPTGVEEEEYSVSRNTGGTRQGGEKGRAKAEVNREQHRHNSGLVATAGLQGCRTKETELGQPQAFPSHSENAQRAERERAGA